MSENTHPFAGFNVLTSKWVPVRMPSGEIQRVSPAEVPACGALEVAHPRPDFCALITEILVCLFQTLVPPPDRSARRRMRTELPALFGFVANAHLFDVFGTGPRFLQSPSPLGEERPSSRLVYEAPASQTLKHNKDLFVSRDDFQTLCVDCVPALLFLNQAHARQGGKGYMVGPRGGSALTALLKGKDLWHTIVLNLLPADTFSTRYAFEGAPEDVFPWSSGLETFSQKTVTPQQIGQYGVLWWNPVALHLEAVSNDSRTPCSLCGQVHSHKLAPTMHRAATCARFPDGLEHPHTVQRENADGTELYPVQVPLRGRLLGGWVALSLGLANPRGKKTTRPLPVLAFRSESDRANSQLWTFGASCDTNSMMRWYDEVVPALVCDEAVQPALAAAAGKFLAEAERVLTVLDRTFRPPTVKARQRGARILVLKANVESALESFGLSCRKLITEGLRQFDQFHGSAPAGVYESYKATLHTQALAIFDEYVLLDPTRPKGLLQDLEIRRRLQKLLDAKPPKAKKQKKEDVNV